MSSNSLSTDDEFDKIKEAIDENFFTKDLYAPGELKKFENLPKPTSVRNQNHQKISNNPFSIKATPEFQDYVSKHLSRLLDDLIDDSEIIIKKKKLKTSHLICGVKLLCSSKDYIKFVSNTAPSVKLKKFAKKKNFNSTNYEKRAKEVAVTPEWVLSQEETKCWAPYSKGEIEIVKLDNVCTENNYKKPKTNLI